MILWNWIIKWSYEKTWNFLLIKTKSDGELSCDTCTEISDLQLLPDIEHITQVVSSIRVTYFYEIHPTSALRPNEYYLHWSMMLGKEVSCEIYTQFTDTRILNIHGTKSHCGCISVCNSWCDFQVFPVSVSLKCSVPNNASQQCFPEVTNFGMAQSCYSKHQLWQPVRWGNVQHSLNMSSVCSKILRHVSMCIIDFLQMITITVMASHIDSCELVLISSLA
jgi:hypothetical protein